MSSRERRSQNHSYDKDPAYWQWIVDMMQQDKPGLHPAAGAYPSKESRRRSLIGAQITRKKAGRGPLACGSKLGDFR
jgi:hypothetical protein